MKATTKTQAQRIAYFGAKKMQDGGYRMERTRWIGTYEIRKDGDGRAYRVRVGHRSMPDTCNCPFFTENAEHGICKHIYWVRWELERIEEEARAEAAAAHLEACDEARAFMAWTADVHMNPDADLEPVW